MRVLDYGLKQGAGGRVGGDSPNATIYMSYEAT